MPGHIQLRAMTAADVPFGMKLKDLAGWNQLESDWHRFLQLEPDGCFVARLDGEEAGTVTTIDFERKFGWVGMVLVLPEKRRRGVGTALLKHAIHYLQEAGVQTVKLDATPMGKKVYDLLDFQDEYLIERRQGVGTAGTACECGRLDGPSITEAIQFDTPIFGADRGPVLRKLAAENPGRSFLHRDQDGIVDGYAIARPGRNAFQIGPWVAASAEAGDVLFRALLGALEGETVFLDVVMLNQHAVELTRRYGFETQRPLIRMCLGPNGFPGRPAQVYAASGPEKG